MIKAVASTLIATAILFGGLAVRAEQSPAETAAEEGVKRQAETIQLRRLIAEAKALGAKGDPAAAAKRYEDAWQLAQRIGPSAEKEAAEVAAGNSVERLELTRQAIKAQNLSEADAQVKSALRMEPKNAIALELKADVDRRIEESRGKTPSKEVVARQADFKEERIKTSTLVQDARLLIEMGKLDDADVKLKQATKEDPENRAAFYYMGLIKEARYAQEARKREMDGRDSLVEVEKAWSKPIQRELLPIGNPFAHTNRVYTSAGRQQIYHKLENLRFERYDILAEQSLSDVIKDLSDKIRKRDPEKRGLNFLISSTADHQSSAGGLGGIDPATGQPLGAAPEVAVDLEQFQVRIDPPLMNVRVLDILDAIIKVAKPGGDAKSSGLGLKYSVEDYAIVFTQKAAEFEPLFSRTFKVNPNTFFQGLENVGAQANVYEAVQVTGGGGQGGGGAQQSQQQGGSSTGTDSGAFGFNFQSSQGGCGGGGGGQGGVVQGIQFVTTATNLNFINERVRLFFQSAGVNFPTNNNQSAQGGFGGGQAQLGGLGQQAQPPSKSLFFNDRSGLLFVRATLSDLDIIENALQILNTAPPEVMIETKLAEISQNDQKAVGFDWFLGNFLVGGKAVGAQGGSAPAFQGASSTANGGGVFPKASGIPLSGTTDSEGRITTGLRNGAIPEVATVSGILSDPQFRVVIRALEQRGGVDLLSAPRVTTVSGRQARVAVQDVRGVVIGYTQSTLNNQNQAGGNGNIIQNVQNSLSPSVQLLSFGQTLDVIPYVSADGYTIEMNLIPTLKEFLGYDTATGAQFRSIVGNTPVAQTPIPQFRVRQIATTAIVWDGQTVVLGGLIAENVSKQKDKVPVLGDIPLLGRLFRSESSSSEKRNLVIFVTPTIIDPAGNRVHTPDNLPYDPKQIPEQKISDRAMEKVESK